MSTEKPRRSFVDIVLRNPISVVGLVGLLADLIGLGSWAKHVIVGGDTSQLVWRFLVLVIMFAFSTGLIVWGSEVTKRDARKFALWGWLVVLLVLAISFAFDIAAITSFRVFVLLGILLMPLGFIAMLYWTSNLYRRRVEQRNIVIVKLQEKERELLSSIEDHVSALLEEEKR